MDTPVGRFWRYENAFISLIPVDPTQPRLGGKVQVKSLTMDWRTFTPTFKTLHGVYSDDFITFGEFRKEAGNPLENEGELIKICDDNDILTVPVKNKFRFENYKLFFTKTVNGEVRDLEIEHPIPESELEVMIDQSWTEVLFYGLANKRIAAPKLKKGE